MQEQETLLNKVKDSLDIKHNIKNNEIQDNIDSGILELSLAGIDTTDINTDTLLQHAIKLYCKWNYNYNDNSSAYEKSFEKLKIALSLSSKYKVKAGDSAGESNA